MVDHTAKLRIASLVPASIVSVTTIARLILRRRGLWWDDTCAFLSFACLVLQITGTMIHTEDGTKIPRKEKLIAYYFISNGFYGIIWFARLSILFSIMRIDPSEKNRKRLFGVAGLFALTLAVLVAQVFWTCVPDQTWRDKIQPQCILPTQVGILQIITDIFSDVILLVLPLKLFRDILDRTLRRRLMFIFSTVIATTIVAMVHSVYILRRGGEKTLFAGIVEACVSLAVCNLPVLCGAIFHLTSKKPDTATASLRFARNEGITTTIDRPDTTDLNLIEIADFNHSSDHKAAVGFGAAISRVDSSRSSLSQEKASKESRKFTAI